MNIHLTGVSSLVEAEGKRKQKGSEDSKASLPLPLKKSASHRFCFRFHITGDNQAEVEEIQREKQAEVQRLQCEAS